MIHINILSRSDRPFYAHWDKCKYPTTEYDIQENSTEDIEWDCVVIYQNIRGEKQFKCKEGNVFYFSGEPPLMAPLPRVFTRQFDTIVVPHSKVRHKNKITSHGFLNWSLGYGHDSKEHRYNYEQLKNFEPQKTKLISIVSSNQTMMPGHNKRMAIIERLQKEYPGIVDVYGRGFKSIDYKADALAPYFFHICIENSSIEHYWTEKISDPILAQCVPIYAGCTNLSSYLGDKGYFKFDIDNYDSLKTIIDKVIVAPEDYYKEYKPYLEQLRINLMERQNLVPFVIDLIHKDDSDRSYRSYYIKPLDGSWQYSLQMAVIRAKRFIYKKWFGLIHKK